MNRESDNIGLVPYNFDPEYLVEEINNRQQLIFRLLTAHLKYCFGFLPKIYV